MPPSLLLPALIGIHAIVGLWAAVGLVEWITAVPWSPITNPELPRALLLVHWLAMAGTAAVFFVGLATRSPMTPPAMIAAYAVLALICAYETFFVLGSRYRFASMALEYLAYGVLTWLWLRSSTLRGSFHLGVPPS